jgi:hypothetical protein
LFRFVYDSHSAAANFTNDPKVAQYTRCGARFGADANSLANWLQLRSSALDKGEAIEAFLQQFGDVGVPCQDIIAIGPSAGLELRQVFLDCPGGSSLP